MNPLQYTHYAQVEWDSERWPNFSPAELACPCCGEYCHDAYSLDLLQKARNLAGTAFVINSGHRCAAHNKELEKDGAAPNSEHLRMAFDIATSNKNRLPIYLALVEAGFTTFGKAISFIHTDKRPSRRWYYGQASKDVWRVMLA